MEMTRQVPKWLLALDVDRTILTDDYRLLDPVRDAIQKARAHGVSVALATARGPVALEVIRRDVGEIDCAVCFGGALILNRHGGEWKAFPGDVDHQATINKDAATNLVSLCREADLSVAGYGLAKVYVDAIDSRLTKEFRHTGDEYEVRDLTGVDDPLFKFLVISSLEQTEKLSALRAQISHQFSCAMSHVNYLEVNPLGSSKGSGLALLAQAIGVDQQHTVAIGDGENDLPMFLWAGTSIAMGNASEKVRQAADWTTKTNAEAGVAFAIQKLFETAW